MLFGDKELLAIQCELSPPHTHHLFGKVLLYAGGKELGDGSAVVVIGDLTGFFKESQTFIGQRADDSFYNKSPAEILSLAYTSLYGPNDQSLANQMASERRYRKFVIMPNGCESFDGEFAILIETTNGQQFIYRDGNDAREISLPKTYYESIIFSFCSWVEKEEGTAMEQRGR